MLSVPLQPTTGREPQHETRLVVLMDRLEAPVRGQYEVTRDLGEQEVPVVHLEAVVRLAPEIGSGIGLDPEDLLRGPDRPARGLGVPTQRSVDVGLVERLAQLRLEHRSTLPGTRMPGKGGARS